MSAVSTEGPVSDGPAGLGDAEVAASSSAANENAGTGPTPEAKPGGSSRRNALMVALAIVVATVVAIGVGVALYDSDEVIDVSIAKNTSDKIAAGASITTLDSPVRYPVGTVLRITNNDDRIHVLGTVDIPAGTTREIVLDQAGTYSEAASFEYSGTVLFQVTG